MNPQQYNQVDPNVPQMAMPGQPMPGQPMTGQPMPGQPQMVQNPQMMQAPQMIMPSGPQMAPAQPMAQPQVIMPGQPQMAPGPQPAMPGQMQQMPAQQNPKPSSKADAKNAGKKDNPISTQATLLISELRDNVVIMKDGSFRAVIACKSINFDLMSEMEREGIEYSYQNFLNSLKFTTQLMVRSQRVDIGPYIDRLSEIRRNNDNMLLGILMDDYINFIDILSQEANIMDKSFFIVIPYYASEDAEKMLQQTKNFFKTFSKAKTPEVTRIDRATYDKALTELTNRVDSVMSGLFQIGVHSVRLNTKELAELYYNFNNPDTAVREPLVDFSKLATMYVRKGEKPTNG